MLAVENVIAREDCTTVYIHHQPANKITLETIIRFLVQTCYFQQFGLTVYEIGITTLSTGLVISFKASPPILPKILCLSIEGISHRYTKSQTNNFIVVDVVDYYLELTQSIVREPPPRIDPKLLELYIKCWKDKLAMKILIDNINMDNEEINIAGLLQKMNDFGLFPRNEYYNNLRCLLNKDSNGYGRISLTNFSGILARFGPIKNMRQKIDSFIVYKTSVSYHGSISVDEATKKLNEFYKIHKVPACLYRNTDSKKNYIKGESILPVFSVSWIICEEGVQHLRIHVDTHGNLCYREANENNVIHAKRIKLWSDIMMKIKKVKGFPLDMVFLPVVTTDYSGLVGDEYVEITGKKARIDFPYDLHDVDKNTQIFGFEDTL